MLYGSIRRNLYAHLSIHKMRWTLVFDYLFTPISTPKWHESIWFCMKFYEFTISKNFVTMRFYGLLLMYIDLWKKANLQRYLISYLHFLLYFRGRKLRNDGSISRFLELSSIINFLTGDLLTFYSPFYALFASSNWRTAWKRESSVTWTYLSIVVLMLAWPNSFCNTMGGIPRSIARVA